MADPRTAARWGPYAAAITRWETLTRPAPDPVDAHGRLQPRFVEWMQGLPHGWVTDLNLDDACDVTDFAPSDVRRGVGCRARRRSAARVYGPARSWNG